MFRRKNTRGQDLGLLALRLTTGGLLAGHGAGGSGADTALGSQ